MKSWICGCFILKTFLYIFVVDYASLKFRLSLLDGIFHRSWLRLSIAS